MFYNPINYDEPVFRPPGEARSAILQATIGCSWNECAFCEMYTSKKFRVRKHEEIKADIESLARFYGGSAKKVFLGDGNAFVMTAGKLMPILHHIREMFGKLQRISAYASPRDILAKTDQELTELKEAGLKLLYTGIETGDDELLKLIRKGETHNSVQDAILKAHQAGIDTSIMIINGLGGKKYSQQHALESARIINQVNPKFLSTLTLSFPYGLKHYNHRFEGEYIPQTVAELLQELKLFIENLQVNNVIYRSNHISNHLPLSGTLSKDQDRLLRQLELAIAKTPPQLMPESREVL